ncbi:MAG: acyltransferase [Desulfobulbaceae bacterium]|nr:acyltransferase [Desulfobulbaceae bacterium]
MMRSPKGNTPHLYQDKSNEERLASLDQLRGVCALLVVIHHMLGLLPISSRGDWIFDYVVDLGRIGVVGFFAISGYVIPLSLKLDGVFTFNKLLIFWIKRFFRLWPLYVCVIVFAITYDLEETGYIFSWRERMVNLTMLQQYFGVPNILGVFWTLSIELFYYAVVSAFLLLKIKESEQNLLRNVNLMLASAIFLSVIRYAYDIKLPVALFLALATMSLGGLYRICGTSTLRRNWVIWSCCLVLICILSYSKDYGFNEHPTRYIVSYFTGIILFIWSFRWAKINILKTMGIISYSIYLIHALVISSINRLQSTIEWHGMMVIFIAIIFISSCSYLLIERPFVYIGRRIAASIKTNT